jgi:hypothetical protein
MISAFQTSVELSYSHTSTWVADGFGSGTNPATEINWLNAALNTYLGISPSDATFVIKSEPSGGVPVPEPGTVALMLTGIAGLVAAPRRNQQ